MPLQLKTSRVLSGLSCLLWQTDIISATLNTSDGNWFYVTRTKPIVRWIASELRAVTCNRASLANKRNNQSFSGQRFINRQSTRNSKQITYALSLLRMTFDVIVTTTTHMPLLTQCVACRCTISWHYTWRAVAQVPAQLRSFSRFFAGPVKTVDSPTTRYSTLLLAWRYL